MILVFGGTTEGRQTAELLEQAGTTFYYSTKTPDQQLTLHHGTRLVGPLDRQAMSTFCQDHAVRLIVNAAHPFAEILHRTIAEVSGQLCIPVVRMERTYPPLEAPCVPCDDVADMIRKALSHLSDHTPLRILALTGVQTIAKLRPLWTHPGVECWFRILDRESSHQMALAQGFLADRLITLNLSAPQSLDPSQLPSFHLILTKESGLSGGFETKVQLARTMGIPLLVVRRPQDFSAHRATGPHSLRRAVEQLCPGFFPLRSGFTTGSCATAAALAAAHILLGHEHPRQVRFTLPDGEWMEMPIARTSAGNGWAQATVIKDAGDDPDVTHGTAIVSRVTMGNPSQPYSLNHIAITGGLGVGRVTLPGLGLPIGSAAINPVPQQMIRHNLSRVLPSTLSVEVSISVPQGRELAARTFNSRVGVVDGISIIGTRGTVQPFSSEAFVGAIRREMEVAVALGTTHLVLNSGGKSEALVRQRIQGESTFYIHYGNFIGDALRIASELAFPRVTLGIMIGKAVKLAAGNLNTHSHQVVMDKAFLTRLARQVGCSPAAAQAIETITLAREIPERLTPSDFTLFAEALRQACHRVARTAFPTGELQIILLQES